LARKAAIQIINDLSACRTNKHVNHLHFFVYAGKESLIAIGLPPAKVVQIFD